MGQLHMLLLFPLVNLPYLYIHLSEFWILACVSQSLETCQHKNRKWLGEKLLYSLIICLSLNDHKENLDIIFFHRSFSHMSYTMAGQPNQQRDELCPTLLTGLCLTNFCNLIGFLIKGFFIQPLWNVSPCYRLEKQLLALCCIVKIKTLPLDFKSFIFVECGSMLSYLSFFCTLLK